MDITDKQQGLATVISIQGSIDAMTASEVTTYFSRQIGDGKRNIVADLSQVDFMSSAGLRAFLATLKESRRQGGDLHLAAPQPGVERILKMSGFTSILKTFPTVAEAVSGFAA
jgi:anti-anti-sigma factor